MRPGLVLDIAVVTVSKSIANGYGQAGAVLLILLVNRRILQVPYQSMRQLPADGKSVTLNAVTHQIFAVHPICYNVYFWTCARLTQVDRRDFALFPCILLRASRTTLPLCFEAHNLVLRR